MDAALVHTYRLVWADLTLLLDTASIYYSRRPVGGYRLSDFASGLSLVLKTEEREREEREGGEGGWSDQLQEEEGAVDFSEGR